MSAKRQEIALITGISGQDGSYLAEQLLAQGVSVVGTTRRLGVDFNSALKHSSAAFKVLEWDLLEKDRFSRILDEYCPTSIYNLAAFSSGEHMDRDPEAVTEINGLAVLKMLDAIKQTGAPVRFCQASSSEVFAGNATFPKSEKGARVPRSVYGAAKILADNFVKIYREKYGLFCCSAILFNHESPRRGVGFVTRKIVRAAVAIKEGRMERLVLGDLGAVRDWGFAGDYVRAMTMMLAADKPADYVIATGNAHTVADLCDRVFAALLLDYREFVVVDETFLRPPEAVPIIGDATLARQELGWTPSVAFDELVMMMVDAEIRLLKSTD